MRFYLFLQFVIFSLPINKLFLKMFPAQECINLLSTHEKREKI
jgi:hypothetical protein